MAAVGVVAGRVVRVRPGKEAEAALCLAIGRSQASDPLAPVTVVVRSGIVGLDLRRTLAGGGAFAGVRFLPMSRLIELLGSSSVAAAMPGARPLTTAVLGAAVRVVLARDAGVFEPVAMHPATEKSLGASYRLLRPLSPDELDSLGRKSPRAGDVVRIFGEVRDLLEKERYDLEDLSRVATGGLASGEVDLEAIGDVVVYLPDPLSRSQVRLLSELSRHAEVSMLVGEVGDPVADGPMDRLCRDLVALGWCAEQGDGGERVVACLSPSTGGDLRPAVSQVIGAPDVEVEARLALGLLMSHAEAGGDLGRTAVAASDTAQGVERLRLLQELCDSAGLTWTGQAEASLAELSEGRLVAGVIELLCADERPFERGAVIAWLSSPALAVDAPLFRGLSFTDGDNTDGDNSAGRIPIGAFDRCSRRAGVISGFEEWDSRLHRRLHGEVDPRVAKDLSSIVGRLNSRLQALRQAQTWREVASWAQRLCELVLPAGESRDRISDALVGLEELEQLEELACESGRRSAQLRSAFGSALAASAPSHGRFGAGPVMGTLSALAGLRSDLLVIVGFEEGQLPSRSTDDPLLTELERASVAGLAEIERAEQRDRRLTLMALAGATTAIACYARVGRGASRPAYRSRWLLGDLDAGPHEECASFSAYLRAVASGRSTPCDAEELELSCCLAATERGQLPSSTFLSKLPSSGEVPQLPCLGKQYQAERERSRSGAGLNRFGGYVGSAAVGSNAVGRVMSATGAEALAKCPMQFMFDRLERVEPLSAPERLDTISPLERGSLIHSILEQFVAATALSRLHFDGFTTSDLATLSTIAASELDAAERRGVTGKPLFWQMERAQILADLERFVALESERLSERGGRPIRTEWSFGKGDVPPLEIVVGTRTMRFRGQVDRIDRERDGTIRVVDYKSGRPSGYEALESDPLGAGRFLQLPIYARAVAALDQVDGKKVVAEYRFCSAAGGFKQLAVELDQDLETELRETLETLATVIEEGTFVPRPGGEEPYEQHCQSCDHVSVCRLDRRAHWRQAREEPAMAAYVALVEKSSRASEGVADGR